MTPILDFKKLVEELIAPFDGKVEIVVTILSPDCVQVAIQNLRFVGVCEAQAFGACYLELVFGGLRELQHAIKQKVETTTTLVALARAAKNPKPLPSSLLPIRHSIYTNETNPFHTHTIQADVCWCHRLQQPGGKNVLVSDGKGGTHWILTSPVSSAPKLELSETLIGHYHTRDCWCRRLRNPEDTHVDMPDRHGNRHWVRK